VTRWYPVRTAHFFQNIWSHELQISLPILCNQQSWQGFPKVGLGFCYHIITRAMQMFSMSLLISSWKDSSFTGSNKEKEKLSFWIAPLLEIFPLHLFSCVVLIILQTSAYPVTSLSQSCMEHLLPESPGACIIVVVCLQGDICQTGNYPQHLTLPTSEKTTGRFQPVPWRTSVLWWCTVTFLTPHK